MKLITLYLPDKYLDILESFVDEGLFPNRSEAIRMAVRDLIKNERKFMENKNNGESSEIIEEY
ncbi:MAG: ribbon-helix-helix protein, CopG family [archaeon]|nr:ribbon-helix-helix protein, CopG family [archaeon]